MCKHVVPWIPKKLPFYIEPFAGGASVFFALPEKPGVTVLNDTRDELINFYRIVQTSADELASRLAATLHSESDWRRAHAISSDATADPLERAWATHVRIQQSFACMGETWARDNMGWGRRQGPTLRLDSARRLRDGVEISCEDALKCIRRRDRPEAFFFVDPPYPGTQQKGWQPFSLEQYAELIDTLDNLQGSFILTCYPMNPEPKNCEKKIVTRTAGMNTQLGPNREPIQECIYRRLNDFHCEI